MRVLIVGGGGYIGFHIGLELASRQHEVTLFDLHPPNPVWYDKSETCPLPFVTGSILCLPDLEQVLSLSKAEGVIHCAAHGMSSREQLPSASSLTESINIDGTSLLLKVCSGPSSSVTSLVYTSTFNVVFGCDEIIGGDENLPYFPLHRHWDNYSISKSVAERLVLASSGKNKKFHTCSLRLAGVMGVGETRHLPRIVASLPFLKFRYGNAKVQFVGIKNAVQAHVKALEKLHDDPDVVGGEAYFISDGKPIEHWEYFRPLIEGLGYTYPKWVLPVGLMWIFVLLGQFFLRVFGEIWGAGRGLFLSPAELLKTSVTHWFSIDKAKQHFGYAPEDVNDLSGVLHEYRRKMGLSPLLKFRKNDT